MIRPRSYRHHQPLEAHTRREHGDNFGILCQFGGEKDDGNEDKQGTEEVGIIGYEIQVVIEYDCFQRCLVVDEVIDIFIDIKYDSDGDDQAMAKK